MSEAVIWPANIDAEKSKAGGRKISTKKAVPTPTLAEIEAAAKKLGLEPKTEKEKAYPKSWWAKTGLIKVEKTKPKNQILSEIAREIRKERG